MIKTLCSISLLLLASGWLSILPAETPRRNMSAINCNKRVFSSKSEESQKCPKNRLGKSYNDLGPHQYREVKTGSKAKNDQNLLLDHTTSLGIRLAQHSTGTDPDKIGLHFLQQGVHLQFRGKSKMLSEFVQERSAQYP